MKLNNLAYNDLTQMKNKEIKLNGFKKYCAFNGQLIMVGFGSIGQGVLPLLLRHIDIKPEQIIIAAADDFGIDIAREYRVQHKILPLTSSNYQQQLKPYLKSGNFLLNLSVDVSSVALIKLCREYNMLYLDTCIEPWAGGYFLKRYRCLNVQITVCARKPYSYVLQRQHRQLF